MVKNTPAMGKIPWRRVRQPTPVFLPEESPWTGVGYGSWGHKESDMTELLSTAWYITSKRSLMPFSAATHF